MLSVHYSMKICFSAPVMNHEFTLRCLPRNTQRQYVMNTSYLIGETDKIWTAGDSFDNECILGRADGESTSLTVTMDSILGRNEKEYEDDARGEKQVIYKYPGLLTVPGDALAEMAGELELGSYIGAGGKLTSRTPRSMAEEIMHYLHSNLEYVPGTTFMTTTAEEAAASRKGVCQDFSHIMISLCRKAGIPARYAAGLSAGTGESHAWVEICSEDKWYGLDPTNDCYAGQSHIVMAYGRDAADSPLNKGIFYGKAVQTRNVSTKVTII